MNKKAKFILAVMILAAVSIFFLLSPFFYVTEIVVNGNLTVGGDEIIKRAGLEKKINIFLLSSKETEKKIKENFYVESAVLTKQLPSSVVVTVTERRLCGYIEYAGDMYLYIDDNGRVLEINRHKSQPLPVINGLNFDRFRLGEQLVTENPSALRSVVVYARLLVIYNLLDIISHIDVSDAQNIRMRVNNIDIHFGGTRDADEKIRTMKASLENLPDAKNIRGILYITDVSGRYIFRILT